MLLCSSTKTNSLENSCDAVRWAYFVEMFCWGKCACFHHHTNAIWIVDDFPYHISHRVECIFSHLRLNRIFAKPQRCMSFRCRHTHTLISIGGQHPFLCFVKLIRFHQCLYPMGMKCVDNCALCRQLPSVFSLCIRSNFHFIFLNGNIR